MRLDILRASVLAVCLSILTPHSASAAEFTYEIVIKHQFETGEISEMVGGLAKDLFACKREIKKIEIGRKFGRGLIVHADGSSPGGTIIGVRCKQRPAPRMGM